MGLGQNHEADRAMPAKKIIEEQGFCENDWFFIGDIFSDFVYSQSLLSVIIMLGPRGTLL